jgi:hypothetical protein
MVDPNQVLSSNLVEALRQLQQYIVIGLGASVSILALSSAKAARSRVTVPYTSVAVDADIASLILLAMCVLVGAMASYAAETANLIATRLDPTLRIAVCTFPSVATSPYIGVRVLAALLPFIFSMVAVIRLTRSYGAGRHKVIWMAFIILAAPYGALTLALVKSTCLSR